MINDQQMGKFYQQRKKMFIWKVIKGKSLPALEMGERNDF